MARCRDTEEIRVIAVAAAWRTCEDRAMHATELAAPPYRLRVSVGRVTRILVWIVAGLLVAHLVSQLIHYKIHPLNNALKVMLDVDEETNLPSWYSWTALLAAS